MQINNLEERELFWSELMETNPGWDVASPTNILNKNLQLFHGKSVLEIGPGNGRQFKKIYPLTKKYIIIDISQSVLNQAIFQNIEKYKIKSYNNWKHLKVDIVHFWFVVHHIKLNELNSFFKFVHSTLVEDGRAFFNFPIHINKSTTSDDGMKTTPIKEKHIFNSINELFKIEIIPAAHLVDKYEHQKTYLLRKISSNKK